MSASERKTRPDAVLQNLPEDRQDEIGSWMLPGKGNKSFAKIQKILAGDGIRVSQQALSRFYSWWWLRKQNQQTEEDVQTILELDKQTDPSLTPDQLFNRGQRLFSILAMKNQDEKAWFFIQKLNQGREDTKLNRQKFQRETCELFLKWFADKEAKAIASSSASNADKIEALGKKMFGEEW